MRLVAVSGQRTLSFPLREGSTIVGRQASCHISIPANGLSRRHCQVYVDGQSAVIRDLESSNGTHVNGQRVDRAELQDGDIITLGPVQLRFESTDQEGAAGPIPDANEPPTEAQPAYQAEEQEPPPAPTDFPEEPEGDETPVDASFVPQPYTGGAQVPQTGGEPQLVVRDGRWFLRDPMTGREVEIQPKEGAAAVAAPAEARRPNVRLLVAVIGLAAVAVGAFAVFFLPQEETQPSPSQRFPTATYNNYLDQAVGHVRKGEYEEALEILDALQKRRQDIETARLLGQYTRLLQKAEGKVYALPLDDALHYLKSILEEPSVRDARDTVVYVKEQRSRLLQELGLLGKARQALATLEREGESEDTLLKAYRQLRELPPDSAAGRKYADDAQRLRTRLARHYQARAEDARRAERWAEAAEDLEKAKEFVDDKEAIDQEIERCHLYARHKQTLAATNELFEQRRYDEARRRLLDEKSGELRIRPPSPYASAAKGLLDRIERTVAEQTRERLQEQAIDLYKRGAGREAIKLIEEHDLRGLAYIRDQVEKLERLAAEGKKAEEEGRYEDALQAYQDAAAIDAGPDNAYAQEAARRLEAFKARFPDIAEELAMQASQLIGPDPAAAREGFKRALRFDPDNQVATENLKLLDRNAKLLYSRGSVALDEGKHREAKRLLDRALKCAERGSPLYASILKALERLPKD
ncbi:MAG: FHA domain-containing protein [Candidatus Brocadiia bacterium]